MNNTQAERRERMLSKVRKLLSMGRDGRGNETEQETAMRQANALMAQFGIEEAECDMSQLDAGEMVFGEAQCTPDGKAPGDGKIHRTAPVWAGVIAIGIGRFCNAIVRRRDTAKGQVFIFQGEKNDVLLARWLFGVLVNSIQSEQKASGWTKRAEAGTFRMAAAGELQQRLKALADDRVKMYQEAVKASNSRALVVVDRKVAEIAKRFGPQKYSNTGSYGSGGRGAYLAGREAGARINIPSGRPIAGNAKSRIGQR